MTGAMAAITVIARVADLADHPVGPAANPEVWRGTAWVSAPARAILPIAVKPVRRARHLCDVASRVMVRIWIATEMV